MKEKNNLLGKRFERLLVIKMIGLESESKTDWLCQCDCGNQAIVRGSSLIYGLTKSCGCLRKDILSTTRRQDLTGKNFGYLFVTGTIRRSIDSIFWECVCKCGRIIYVSTSNLNCGNSTSCGCKRKEYLVVNNKTHGLCHLSEYGIWAAIKARCYNPKNTSFELYGARGITVCPEWKDSFETFYKDMGPRPSPDHSIDRIDPNGNYEPSNCRWATIKEQARNKRNSRLEFYEGELINLAEISEITNVDYDKLKYRLNTGMEIDDIIKLLNNQGDNNEE